VKVIFIYHDRPNYRGGPIVNARRLLPELVRRGHDVHCLLHYSGDHASAAENLRAQGVEVHAERRPWSTESGIRQILTLARAVSPDAFVPNLSVTGWFAARWVREAGIATVACHRSDDAFYAGMVEQFVCGPKEWAVSGLVCVSQGLHDRVAKRHPRHTRLAVIPSGVPLPAVIAAQSDAPLSLVYVGRLVQEQKRVFDLIEALAAALRALPDATATLIGHTNNPAEAGAVRQRIAAHALGARLQWKGALEPDALSEALSRHQVLVLLSDYEGTPGSVMDGMAAGLVPVCLDISGGIRELVKHGVTGVLVKDRGPSFLRAIEALARDPEGRRCLGAKARAHIERAYSLPVAADRWESFLGELVSQMSRRDGLIQIPRRMALPPVRPGLEREDCRQPPLPRRVVRRLKSAVWSRLPALQDDPSTDPFLAPACAPGNLDRYLARSRILAALRRQLPNLHGTLLDVGCGQMPYRSLLLSPPARVDRYIGLDFEVNPHYANQPDICWTDGRIPLDSQSVDCAMLTEVLEHCPDPEEVLQEVFRVLRSGGRCFVTVPFLWPLHDVPYAEYRYTPFSLRRHLEASGFVVKDLRALGGWDASLAQMVGLWVRRRRMGALTRLVLSLLFFPIYRRLIRGTENSEPAFDGGGMITGLWATVVKPSERDLQ
jgi:glycosyltransferase involved in cell wall biosynthesis/SAM-dependent methyltransferase